MDTLVLLLIFSNDLTNSNPKSIVDLLFSNTISDMLAKFSFTALNPLLFISMRLVTEVPITCDILATDTAPVSLYIMVDEADELSESSPSSIISKSISSSDENDSSPDRSKSSSISKSSISPIIEAPIPNLYAFSSDIVEPVLALLAIFLAPNSKLSLRNLLPLLNSSFCLFNKFFISIGTAFLTLFFLLDFLNSFVTSVEFLLFSLIILFLKELGILLLKTFFSIALILFLKFLPVLFLAKFRHLQSLQEVIVIHHLI